jgi:hypothetical protein
VPHLLASISGIPVYREHNILDELVRRSLALVIDRNLRPAPTATVAAVRLAPGALSGRCPATARQQATPAWTPTARSRACG